MTIVQGPQDLEVTEGDTATFECQLSQALADITWEKVRSHLGITWEKVRCPPGHHNSNNNAPTE